MTNNHIKFIKRDITEQNKLVYSQAEYHIKDVIEAKCILSCLFFIVSKMYFTIITFFYKNSYSYAITLLPNKITKVKRRLINYFYQHVKIYMFSLFVL